MARDTSVKIVGPANTPFRSVVLLVVGLVLISLVLSVTQFLLARRQVYSMMQGQAEGLATAIAQADLLMERALERVESEQGARLIATGMRVRESEVRSPLGIAELERTAVEAGVFNIILFDIDGQRELALRGPLSPGGMNGHGGRGHGGWRSPEHVRQFLASDAPFAVQGSHRSRGSGLPRFSALVRRLNGGAVSLVLDDEEQEQLRRETGPNALLRQLAQQSGVVYLERRIAGQIDTRVESSPAASSTTEDNAELEPDARATVEVEVEIPGESMTSLVVGLDAQPLGAAVRLMLVRLLVSIGLIVALASIGLLWTRMQKRHGALAADLQRVTSYHKVLLERMGDAVLAWEDREGLTFWNQCAEKIFPSLRNTKSGDAAPAEVLEVADAVRNSEGETVVPLGEAGAERGEKCGIRRFRATGETLDGPGMTHLLFLNDVTAVELANSERHRREHFEALARVASGVAHEVRNPLNAIDMTIQALCTEPSTLEAEDRVAIEGLRGEIARINGMVEHFLAYGRPREPVFSQADPAHILSDVATLLAPVAEKKRIALRTEVDDVPAIAADAQQLCQALINITLNALEASEPGGEVLLSAKCSGQDVVLGCQDRGVGMTLEQREQLFDPYVTTKPSGTGLGMSIVQRIVDGHSGRISVISEPGQGSAISLWLPKSASLPIDTEGRER